MNKHVTEFFAAKTSEVSRNISKDLLRLRLGILLLAFDLVTIKIAFLTINSAFAASASNPATDVAETIAFPIFLISAFMVRAYSGPVMINWGASISRALLALTVTAIVVGLILFSLHSVSIVARLADPLVAAMVGVLMTGVHYCHARHTYNALGGALHSIVELRDGSAAEPGCDDTALDTRFFFDPAFPTPESYDRLASVIAGADRVIVHCDDSRRVVWTHALIGMNVHAEFLVNEWKDIHPLGIGEHNGKRTMVVACGPLSFHDRMIKRCFDIAVSFTALVLLLPFLILVALAIKLDSPGPVFFVQPRIGRQNQLFSLIKFRSMRQDCCDAAGTRSTSRSDSRVTRVGHFIRRTSLDELPQIINILKGDMSVVGPRPHAVSSTAEDQLFWEIDNRYWHRHACRPGLTGLAQIQGLRGATACVRDLTERVEADLKYLQRWSFWSDIKIVVLTFKVLRHSNSF